MKTLSDKIVRNNLPDNYMPWLQVEDVKQFIKDLKNYVEMEKDTHIRYGKATTETKMRFEDIIKDINKLSGFAICDSEEKEKIE